MAAEIITGTAVLHGIQNNGSAITVTGYATFLLEKADSQHVFDKYKVKDPLGNDASAVAYNERAEITIDFTPSGATRTAAAAIPIYPAPLAAITLSNLKTNGNFASTGAAQWNGTWLYEGDARIAQTSGQPCKLTGLKLTKYADNAQNTSMTTTVVG